MTLSECSSGSMDVFGVPFLIFVPVVGCVVAFLFSWIISDEGFDTLSPILRRIGRVLRPVGRAIRWVHQHLFLIYAWVCVLVLVFSSIVFGYLAWNGSPVPFLDFWPLGVLGLLTSFFEYLHERFEK